jgi:hypothetical protein
MQEAFRIDAERVVQALITKGLIQKGDCPDNTNATLASVIIQGTKLVITLHFTCPICGDSDVVVDVPFKAKEEDM